ncbi:MAG: sulfatase-like hydrolase/transferase [Kiritimatiellae bacterium]|nr:sulfatase-like hydrolase/transferase [Kiritimatiellia bacterium]
MDSMKAGNQDVKPNIIFIFVDDLGWGDLACYGNLFCRTPSLCRMADDGALFEQFYVGAPLCSPSRAAALTGQFPARHGIHYWMAPRHNAKYGMPEYLDPAVPTIPRLLREAGYRTAHFGKWHIGDSAEAPVASYGFDEVDCVWQGIGPNPGMKANDPHGTELLVDRTCAFVSECLKDDVPFYVNLWPRDVHAALNPTEASLSRYKHLMSQGEFKTAMQIYYAAVTEMDAQIGRLLDWIDHKPGLAENTLVVFSSDNGPEDIYIAHAGHHAVGLPGPFRGRKRSLYEGGIRLPFIVRWKNHVPAGRVDRSSVLSAVDLLPTFAALAAMDIPDGHTLDGEDVSVALLSGKGCERKKPLYWEWRFDGVGQCLNRSPMLAVRDGHWKLLLNPDRSRVELYDIPRQPMELHSQADKHPAVVERLADMAIQWQNTLPPGPLTDRPGSDAYPGYPENAGRGPHMSPSDYRGIMRPVRVTLTENDLLND